MSETRNFLFALPGTNSPSSARKVHIRRLYDVLQVCIQRNDVPRFKRAWAILSRCQEVPWIEMWTTAVHVLCDEFDHDETNTEQLEFLRAMMLQYPEARELILKELVLRLISLGNHKEALDELELYLPSVPYQDDFLLHLYAGLTSLYLAQPKPAHGNRIDKNLFDPTLLRFARTNFERAKQLDPNNAIAENYLRKLDNISGPSAGKDQESDEDMVGSSSRETDRKRVRT